MTPYDASVFVDGTYVGVASTFDGMRQPLTLESRPGALLPARLLLLAIQLDDVDAVGFFTEQPAAEVVGPYPEEIILLGLIAVAQSRQHEEVEALVRFDQRVGHPQRVGHV